MSRPLIVILAAVTLDAIGIGLIFPILPALLKEVTGRGDVTLAYGAMIAAYALMQFLFAPLLGRLSDRFGRRPVLIVALLGAAVDYAFMAVAPSLWMLFVGRIVAGVTAANLAVATAYITDISAPEDRARRFGYFHAMFGIGFIVGPVLGGVLGDHWVRAPFLAAAALNGLNAILAAFLLPESRPQRRAAPRPDQRSAVNPFAPLAWALRSPGLLPMMAIWMLLYLVGQVYGSAWALYGQERFGWSGTMIGLSLATYGLFHAGAQALLTGPAVRALGERRAMLVGAAAEVVSLLGVALATQGWVLFALCPLFAVAGIGIPAFQSLVTQRVDGDRQGELQGVLTSLGSLTAVAGPLLFTGIYAATRLSHPGAVWAAAALVYVAALPLMLRVADRRAG